MRAVLSMLGFAVLALVAVALALVVLQGAAIVHLEFAEPWRLLAAVVPVGAVVLRQVLRPRPPTLRFSRVHSLRRIGRGWLSHFAELPDGFRLAAALLVVVALSRPQSTRGNDVIHHEGIDIVIVLDLSDSMENPDIPPNRLGAAQFVIDDFIRRRPNDRIGLVVFGSSASTVAPLTMDHGVLRALVKRLRLGVMDGSTTAIGAGLGVALNRLEESEAQSKIVVLLTDGVHNADGLDPDSAAQEASERGATVYTILMGQHARTMVGSVDPARLERIASVTGGYAYTAADQDALRGSFQDLLDKLEKSSIEGERVRPELFMWFLWPALGLLLLDVVARSTRLRRFP